MNYEDSTIQTVIPERHVVMGRRFYGKIVSLIGSGFGSGKGGFFKNMLKLKMMSSMLGNGSGDGMFSGNGLAMMMLMGNGSMDGLFDGFIDNDEEDDEDNSNIFDKLVSGSEDEEDDEVLAKKSAKKAVKRLAKTKKAK